MNLLDRCHKYCLHALQICNMELNQLGLIRGNKIGAQMLDAIRNRKFVTQETRNYKIARI